MIPCPHCREAFEELQEELRQVKASVLFTNGFETPKAWGLTRSESAIMSLLIRHALVRRGMIEAELRELRPKWDAHSKIIDVFICKMRPKVRPFGFDIQNVWGRGYQMPLEHRQRASEASGIALYEQRGAA